MPVASDHGAMRADVVVAVKSAIILGGSLLATWTVAIIVRLFLPRYLGPETFGAFNFADSFTATFFVLLTLGVDTYIQKEIPRRPSHASDFFGGVLLFRILLSGALFAAMAIVMSLANRPPEVQRAVFVFGVAQLVITVNNNLAAMLHAARAVSGLSIINIVSKLLWGACTVFAAVSAMGLSGLAFAFLLSELVRLAVLAKLVRRHLGLELGWDACAVKMVVIASLPFYLNQVANTVYGKVGVSILAVLSNDLEVGYYGSASNLSGLALLVSPLISWVLLPLLSRAASRSEEELYFILRRAVFAILMLALPVSLIMGIGADVLTLTLFGPAYTKAALSLAILAPMFVLTYLAMVTATCLIMLERAWTVTVISLVALVIHPVLDLVFIPLFASRLGPGGAGAGAASAIILTELGVTIALTVAVRGRTFDRSSLIAFGKALSACILVGALDRQLRALGFFRLAVDAVAYLILILAFGAVKIGDIKKAVLTIAQKRQEHAIS